MLQAAELTIRLNRAAVALALAAAAALPATARETPDRGRASHGAIAYHAESGNVGWAADRRTAREAQLEALRLCGHPQCEVRVSVRGGCAALARGGARLVAQRGASRAEAQAKALRRCGEGCEPVAWVCTR